MTIIDIGKRVYFVKHSFWKSNVPSSNCIADEYSAFISLLLQLACMLMCVSIIRTPKASHKLHYGDENNDDSIKSKVWKEFIFTYRPFSLYVSSSIHASNTIVQAIMQIDASFSICCKSIQWINGTCQQQGNWSGRREQKRIKKRKQIFRIWHAFTVHFIV